MILKWRQCWNRTPKWSKTLQHMCPLETECWRNFFRSSATSENLFQQLCEISVASLKLLETWLPYRPEQVCCKPEKTQRTKQLWSSIFINDCKSRFTNTLKIAAIEPCCKWSQKGKNSGCVCMHSMDAWFHLLCKCSIPSFSLSLSQSTQQLFLKNMTFGLLSSSCGYVLSEYSVKHMGGNWQGVYRDGCLWKRVKVFTTTERQNGFVLFSKELNCTVPAGSILLNHVSRHRKGSLEEDAKP